MFFRKGPNLWKLDVPSLVCGISDIFDEFVTLLKYVFIRDFNIKNILFNKISQIFLGLMLNELPITSCPSDTDLKLRVA